MTVEGSEPVVSVTIKRDSFGHWRVKLIVPDGEYESLGRTLEQALVQVWAQAPNRKALDVRPAAKFLEDLLR